MQLVFRDSLADARRRGVRPQTALWVRTAGDLVALGTRLHADAWRQDLSYAQRTLRRTPTFSIAGVATMAIGLGPMLVIANLLYQVVLQPLPFADSDRLVGGMERATCPQSARASAFASRFHRLQRRSARIRGARRAYGHQRRRHRYSGAPPGCRRAHDGRPLRRVDGRLFDDRDSATAPPVLIVSETFAREQFPGGQAVGQFIRFYSARPDTPPPASREIVGVVRDVRQDGVRIRPMAQMYAPYAQSPWGFVSFFVRTEADPSLPVSSLQRAVSKVDPMRPVRNLRTTNEIVARCRGSARSHGC